jgi:hypothetical protein
MSAMTGYMIAYSDGNYETILPTNDVLPHTVYKSIDAAENALKTWVSSAFENFREVLYGQAYPYDKTSARAELQKTGRALYGWATLEDDDDIETYSVYIISVSV